MMVVSLENEEWKVIPYLKHYAISSLGRIKTLSFQKWNEHNKSFNNMPERLLIPSNNNSKKYFRIGLDTLDGERKTFSIHILVAEAFIPNNDPVNKTQVNHKKGIKADNRATELEWCTQSENMRHRIDVLGIKIQKDGETCNFAILTEKEVLQIPKLLETMSKTEIARKFDVAPSTITEITSGRSWKHLNLVFPESRGKKSYSIQQEKEMISLIDMKNLTAWEIAKKIGVREHIVKAFKKKLQTE